MIVVFMLYDLLLVISIKILLVSFFLLVLKLLVVVYVSVVVIWVFLGWYGILFMVVIKDVIVWWLFKVNWWLIVVVKVFIFILVLVGLMLNIEINDFIVFSVILKFESLIDLDVFSKKIIFLGVVL